MSITLAKGSTYIDGSSGSVTITGGTINNTTIGATTPSSGVFTTVTASGGTLNNVVIGGTTPAAGSFTTIAGYRAIVTTTGSKTLALTDASTFQYCTSGSATVLTIPLNATVAFPIGTEIEIFQSGAGQVSVAATGGVTINSVSSNLKISAQYGGATLKKVATDTWVLVGSLAA